MADIFISYSRRDRAIVEELARDLKAAHASVWWDDALISGDPFRDSIQAEVAACRVLIVVWTKDSVRSRWVMSEAGRADDAGKLVTLRVAELDPSSIPPPFDVLHADLVTNRPALEAALRRRGLKITLAPRDAPPRPPPPWWRTRRAVAAPLALALAGGAGTFWAARPSPPPPAIDWVQLPAGTRFANMARDVVASFEAPDRTSGRSLDVRPGEIVPAAGIDDPVWRATVRREPWLRFPAGDARFAHVPEADVRLRPPE